MSGIDPSTKYFNTALVSTKIPKRSNYSQRLNQLVQSEAYQQILKAVRAHAKESGLSEEAAAEEIILTFRELDEIFDKYIFQEGFEKLRGQLSS
jgi:hypothetical protein